MFNQDIMDALVQTANEISSLEKKFARTTDRVEQRKIRVEQLGHACDSMTKIERIFDTPLWSPAGNPIPLYEQLRQIRDVRRFVELERGLLHAVGIDPETASWINGEIHDLLDRAQRGNTPAVGDFEAGFRRVKSHVCRTVPLAEDQLHGAEKWRALRRISGGAVVVASNGFFGSFITPAGVAVSIALGSELMVDGIKTLDSRL